MRALLILSFLLAAWSDSFAQFPSYYFTVATDTAIENNALILAGYVKTDTAPVVPDSVIVALRSGAPRPTHMDTTSQYVIHFAPGQDSVAFYIQIMTDTFPEYPEHVLYVLTNPVNGSSIGADSSLLFVLIDTTPPAIISFIVDSVWCYEGKDSFINGVFFSYGNICGVGISVNNPNPFYIRYQANSYGSGTPGYPYLNAVQYSDYFFNPEICYAPPGISYYYKGADLTDENSISNKYFLCLIQNIDANIIIDSTAFFTILPVGYFDTASLSFDTSSIIIINDSFASIGIPITIQNPNRKPMYFHIDTTQASATYPGINYTFNNQEYGYGHGTSHDTFWVNFINPHLTGDTIAMTFALRNDSVNGSADTILSITVIDTGGLFVSFLGAGLSHLKSDSVGYVQVYTSSFAKFPISVDVSYLNGNAIRDTDFIFHDTTITFPAYSFDTISLPVVMLQDHFYQGNTQLVLQLTNVNPSIVKYGITQYTFFIIDDEDSGLNALGIRPLDDDPNFKVHPNPFDNEIDITTALTGYTINITNSIGQNVLHLPGQTGNVNINLADRPAGLYLVRMTYGSGSYITKVLKL